MVLPVAPEVELMAVQQVQESAKPAREEEPIRAESILAERAPVAVAVVANMELLI